MRDHHPGGATRALITSRNPDWPGDLGVQCHALGVLRREESVALLRQHRPNLGDAEADALAAELGDLPLALHLAGRFLARYGRVLTPEKYLAELRSPRLFERLPLREQDGALPTGHSRDVARTFALSYERLNKQYEEDTLALRLLARAAHLVPGEVVPVDLLCITLEQPPDNLDAQLTAEAAVERLVGLGLLEREGEDGLRMHRLVGAYVRQASGDAEAQAAVERMVIAVAGGFADAPTLAPIAEHLPLLRGVTDTALEREDENSVMLCMWLGRNLDRLGAYTPAQPYLERALVISERVFGADHPGTATSLNNLAALYRDQGNYGAALPLYERALAIWEQVLDADRSATATSLNNIALLYRDQGNYRVAQSYAERALTIREQFLGTDHPATAGSLSTLARIYYAQGNYGAALPLYERALAVTEQVLGIDHPATAGSLNNLALFYRAQGNYATALPLYKRALAIFEQVLGANHPHTATSINNLASLYHRQGYYSAALPLYERALSIREQVLGIDHPNTATSLNNLAELYRAQENYRARVIASNS